jgi:hypothetical protein
MALHSWAVVLVIALGLTFRFLLIGNGWPVTNSDEANVGLQAMHIVNRGELPIFVYGDDYNGSLEAYFGAFFFKLLGPSVFALRVGLVLMFGAFLVTVYALGRLLYTRGVALVAVFLLCGGTSLVLSQQVQTGPVLEPPLFGAMSLLLATWLRFGAALPTRRVAHGNGCSRMGCSGLRWALVYGPGSWSSHTSWRALSCWPCSAAMNCQVGRGSRK